MQLGTTTVETAEKLVAVTTMVLMGVNVEAEAVTVLDTWKVVQLAVLVADEVST